MTETAAKKPLLDGSLSIRGVSVRAGAAQLLSGITAVLHPGELCALIGPSGAGKSTLIRVLLGVREASAGDVKLGDGNISVAGPIGYVPQEDALHRTLSVEDELAYAAELRLPDATEEERKGRVTMALAHVGLLDRRTLSIGRLSGGQRKRVSVAMELLTSPGVLILDEPTSGLDPGLEAQLMSLFQNLARAGRIVIVATHAMESLSKCDALMLLCEGQLAYFGSPSDALRYFEVDRHAGIFSVLAKRKGAAWAKLYFEHADRNRYLARPPPALAGAA